MKGLEIILISIFLLSFAFYMLYVVVRYIGYEIFYKGMRDELKRKIMK